MAVCILDYFPAWNRLQQTGTDQNPTQKHGMDQWLINTYARQLATFVLIIIISPKSYIYGHGTCTVGHDKD